MHRTLVAAAALAVALPFTVAAHATPGASQGVSAPRVLVAEMAQHGDGATHRTGDLVIEHPWARATAKGARVGGAFLMIRNAGSDGDRLIAVDTEVAARAELHMTAMEDGVMRMRHVDAGIEVPANGMAELKPGGFHVMLMGLTGPLEEGDSFPVTLTFERAGAVTVDVSVRAAGAMDAGMAHDN